jgi:tRNA (guanine-N7-)-methyltransferase
VSTTDQTPDNAKPNRSREIKSFVIRQGRFTPAQRHAFDAQWSRYGLTLDDQPHQPSEWFGRDAYTVFEIGFGNGEAALAECLRAPQRNVIGVEVHRPGVGRLLREAAENNVQNLRIFNADAIEVLRSAMADHALQEIRLYFPDPWHKARHNKRRIVQSSFMDLIAQKLAPGGLLHMATDWQHYAQHMLAVADASLLFANLAGVGAFAARPDSRPKTHFEKRGERLGHGVWDLLYRRKL